MTVQFYALSYLCGDSGLTRSRSSPMLDSKVIRDIFHLFVYGHKRKKESGVSIEVSKLLLTVFDQNQFKSLQVEYPSGSDFKYLFASAADQFGVACQNHIISNLRKTLKRVVAYHLKIAGLGAVFKLSDLVNLALRRLNRLEKFAGNDGSSDELQKVVKKNREFNADSIAMLDDVLQEYFEEVMDIKGQLEADLTLGTVQYPLTVSKFKSSWFVYLRLFLKCIRQLACVHLKYPKLLPFPAKKLHMVPFTKSGLDCLLQQSQFQKLLHIPTLTTKYKATLTSFSTNFKNLSFKYEVQKDVTSDLIYAKCISVVPNISCSNQSTIGNDYIAAYQDFSSEDEAESMEVDDDDDGNLDEIDDLIEDVEDQNDAGEDEDQDSDTEEGNKRRSVQSCQAIRYFIMSTEDAKSTIKHKVELSADLGINQLIAVFRPNDLQQCLPKEQIQFDKAYRYTLKGEQYLQMIGGQELAQRQQSFNQCCQQFAFHYFPDSSIFANQMQACCRSLDQQIELYSSDQALQLKFDQQELKRQAILGMVSKFLGITGALKSQDRDSYGVYIGDFYKKGEVNHRFSLKSFVKVLNQYAVVYIVPELRTSSLCYECLRKQIISFVVRRKNIADCPKCNRRYDADQLGAANTFFLTRSIITDKAGSIPKAFIPSKYIPKVDE
ncbi:hypothetical protein MP228_000132 [Amoeboaphelidium protococcarum]|nr:hypothetical protein MP228_000132 [Amoeboaphelidium protococcarum]